MKTDVAVNPCPHFSSSVASSHSLSLTFSPQSRAEQQVHCRHARNLISEMTLEGKEMERKKKWRKTVGDRGNR